MHSDSLDEDDDLEWSTDGSGYPQLLSERYPPVRESTIRSLALREVIYSSTKANNRRRDQRQCHANAAQHLPFLISERHKLADIQKLDKVFASKWLSEDEICIGTKDNQLIRWDVAKRLQTSIKLPTKDAGDYERTDFGCGIHFISANSTDTLLASGSTSPCDVAIFDRTTFTPKFILEGHQDWVFAAEFVTPEVLVSGGRDCTVKIWKLNEPEDQLVVKKALVTRREHAKKVRDLKYNTKSKTLTTLSADNYVKFWDVEQYDVTSSVYLNNAFELVCLALDHQKNLVAVGTQFYTYIIDERSSDVVFAVPSKDADWGVRSLALNENILSVGGGMGHLSFFDLRGGHFLNFKSGNDWLSTSDGWLDRDLTFYTQFNGADVPHAIYTHEYSPSKTKLFVGGGPLMLGLKGSYATVWY
eukprot:TRINITY_DN3956_c0_g1_i1.p1 TRINITY_DN3956_c0_g1~~TRINITY_DN3956_c0_g1_i1.p1  ORF type:complete len:416 (-),score=74.54 TRINITY_DN3956_c0_g1_i1:57-1304(-)